MWLRAWFWVTMRGIEGGTSPERHSTVATPSTTSLSGMWGWECTCLPGFLWGFIGISTRPHLQGLNHRYIFLKITIDPHYAWILYLLIDLLLKVPVPSESIRGLPRSFANIRVVKEVSHLSGLFQLRWNKAAFFLLVAAFVLVNKCPFMVFLMLCLLIFLCFFLVLF